MGFGLAALLIVATSTAPAPDAESLARAALTHHSAGEHLEAGEAFLGAYRLSRVHVQLRNAAKSFTKAGERERASALWKELVVHPAASESDKVEARAYLDRIDLPPSPPPPPNLAPAEPPSMDETVGRPASPTWWVIGGLSLAAAAAGGVLFATSAADGSALDDRLAMTNDAGLIVGITHAEFEDAQARFKRDRGLSLALLAAGGVGIIASALGLTFDW